jgi:hypothetical protein
MSALATTTIAAAIAKSSPLRIFSLPSQNTHTHTHTHSFGNLLDRSTVRLFGHALSQLLVFYLNEQLE